MKIIKSILRKERNRKYINDEALDDLLANNPKLGRFYLFPRVPKRLCNLPGKPVISNSGYYTENMLGFLGCYLKLIAKNVKPYIKNIINFLSKLDVLPYLP